MNQKLYEVVSELIDNSIRKDLVREIEGKLETEKDEEVRDNLITDFMFSDDDSAWNDLNQEEQIELRRRHLGY